VFVKIAVFFPVCVCNIVVEVKNSVTVQVDFAFAVEWWWGWKVGRHSNAW